MAPTLPNLQIDITLHTPGWEKHLPDYEEVISEAVSAALNKGLKDQLSSYELSVVLANDSFVQELNRDFRGKDNPTNVLSFPSGITREELPPEEPFPLGDVILALETLATEADVQQKSFSRHLSHLIVHGVLHLLGYDHEKDEEAEAMERLEVEILAGLGINNPYEN